MNGSEIRQIKTLYVYELRKIVCRRIVWITGGIMLLLCVSLSFVDLISTSSAFSEGNEEIVVSGYELMKIGRECARALSGREIDDSLLQEMQDFSRGEEMKRESQDVDPATGIVVSVEPGETEAEREADAKAEPEDIWDRLWDAQKYTPIRIYVYRIMGRPSVLCFWGIFDSVSGGAGHVCPSFGSAVISGEKDLAETAGGGLTK